MGDLRGELKSVRVSREESAWFLLMPSYVGFAVRLVAPCFPELIQSKCGGVGREDVSHKLNRWLSHFGQGGESE